MKEIIYLDTNFLNSFMAQTHRGLPSASTHEQFEQDTRTDSNSTRKQSTHEVSSQLNSGSVNIPFLTISPNGTLTYKYSNNSQADEAFSLSQIEAGKEIISKQLHDNSLIEFENYLNEQGIEIITNVHDTENFNELVGKNVKVSANFSIFDLNYFKTIADPSTLIEILRLTSETQEDEIQPTEKMFKLVNSFIDYLTGILPTNLFLRQGNFVTPLKKEHLRESSSELSFKYGGGSRLQIHVVAKVTRQFESLEVDMFGEDSNFDQVSEMMSGVTGMVLSTVSAVKKGDIILSPVAIYFE